MYDSATHCNTLPHTATHCNTLQHTTPHYTTLQHNHTWCITPCLIHVCTSYMMNIYIHFIHMIRGYFMHIPYIIYCAYMHILHDTYVHMIYSYDSGIYHRYCIYALYSIIRISHYRDWSTWNGDMIQPIADRVPQNPENISKNFQLSTRRTRIDRLLLGTTRKSHGQNSGSLVRFSNNLEIQCHPFCNRL